MNTVADFFPNLPANALVMWVVYYAPPDLPGTKYVLRPLYAERGFIVASPLALSAPTLDEIRAKIPGVATLYLQERAASDPLCIVETWF